MVHFIGVPLGAVAAIFLLYRAVTQGDGITITAIAVYAFGLVAMLGASAAYQLAAPGLLKERLRRLDRAMIFVMIAGTYTPFSATVLVQNGGLQLCALLWALAGIGIFLSLRFPRRFERVIFGLYLAMGWMLVLLIRDCFSIMAPQVLGLLVAGGLAYTIGAVIHTQERIKFHNPIWHTLVLIAAGLQYAAISLQVTGQLI
jgi:hemolysin III